MRPRLKALSREDEYVDLGQSAAAFKRARWLAELAAAVQSAEDAAERLIQSGRHVSETLELKQQLKKVRQEVEDLRLGGWRAPIQEIGSKWIKLGGD